MNNGYWLNLYLFCFIANIAAIFILLGLKWFGCRSWLKLAGVGFSVASTLVLTVDGIQLLQGFHFRKLLPWVNFPLIAIAIAICWLSTHSFTADVKYAFRRNLAKVGLVVIFAVMNCWSLHRLKSLAIVHDFGWHDMAPGSLVEDNRVTAMTRAGSKVQLYKLEVNDVDFGKYAIAAKETTLRNTEPVINVEDPNRNYNCHGWVFTGGKHFLKGSEVEVILQDNGYQPVTQPKENDIVIYRAIDGRILHTGLVRTVLSDGTILIESKWGAAGRYLHLPDNQPYSNQFQYYRGCGPSHVIQLNEAAVAVTKELPRQMASIRP